MVIVITNPRIFENKESTERDRGIETSSGDSEIHLSEVRVGHKVDIIEPIKQVKSLTLSSLFQLFRSNPPELETELKVSKTPKGQKVMNSLVPKPNTFALNFNRLIANKDLINFSTFTSNCCAY